MEYLKDKTHVCNHLLSDSATVAAFCVWGLRWQSKLHFARHYAVESAGGNVMHHSLLFGV
jgi:hypothetical protein